MAISVPFLSDEEIEAAALSLHREVGWLRSNSGDSVVPVEDTLEKHLDLSLDFDDLHQKLGIPMSGSEPEIFGALWANSREVFIDQSLDPEERPEIEGRYRFTVAHEIGHWCLHRTYISGFSQANLFGDGGLETDFVICRASNAKERIEWQADVFASNYLMPAGLVHREWKEAFGRGTPLVFEVFDRSSDWTAPPLGWRGQVHLPPVLERSFDPRAVAYFFFKAAKVLAPRFAVSVQAMQLRLEKLGLLLVQRPSQPSFKCF